MDRRKNQIELCLILLIICGLGVFGLIKKQTYVNMVNSSDKSKIEQLYVGVASDELIDMCYDGIMTELQQTEIIAKVKVLSEPIFASRYYYYDVVFTDVYKGNEIEKGEKASLTKGSWITFLDNKKSDGNVGYSLNLGFRNFLEQDEEYLVFIEKKADTLDESNLCLLSDFVISPVFSYTESESSPHKSEFNDSSFVRYGDVKNEEFFCETEYGIKKLSEMKKILTETYN